MINVNNFRGDLSYISAETATLLPTGAIVSSMPSSEAFFKIKLNDFWIL